MEHTISEHFLNRMFKSVFVAHRRLFLVPLVKNYFRQDTLKMSKKLKKITKIHLVAPLVWDSTLVHL